MGTQPQNEPQANRMPAVAAIEVLIAHRRENQIVVTNQGSSRVWPKLSHHPLDLHYNPSTMGGAVPLALGLALAQPQREVLAVSGDGSLLMSLGSLVTVAASGAKNLTIVLMDNGLYEVTGGQATAGTVANVNWEQIARGSGINNVIEISEMESWRLAAAKLFDQPGPRFVWLHVARTAPELLAAATPPLVEQLARLTANL